MAALFVAGGLQLDLGTPRRVGPGFFPVGVGAILAVLSLGIMLTAIRGEEHAARPQWAACIAILAGLAAFALVVPALALAACGLPVRNGDEPAGPPTALRRQANTRCGRGGAGLAHLHRGAGPALHGIPLAMTDIVANLALGVETALHPVNLLYCFVGIFLGTFIGVLPGIGAMAAISMLLPLSFYLEPTTALVMLAGVYYGAEHGGSIASILLNIPGTPSSAITCIHGYPIARKGRAGVALFLTAMASFLGGMIGILVMVLLSPALASAALSFGPTEYFTVMLLGLVAASVVSSGGALRGVAMVAAGVLLGTVGVDITSGSLRFTMGVPELRDGVSLVVVAMGLFGVAKLIASIRDNGGARAQQRIDYAAFYPSRAVWRRAFGPMLRGGGIGSFFGALPGTGQTVAAFIVYAVEKKVSKNRAAFGQGAIEGVVVPESANNAAAQIAFIPTLTIGVPGSSTMALMIGALMIHGITPGPRILTDHPELVWGLVANFIIGNILLLILNIPLIGLWVRLLRIPYPVLYPTIVVPICVGIYSINNNPFDIWVTLAFGVLGYVLKLYKFDPTAMLIGFVLGPMMEEYLRRAMLLSRGDPMIFLERPISATLLALTAALLVWSAFSALRRRRGRTIAREG